MALGTWIGIHQGWPFPLLLLSPLRHQLLVAAVATLVALGLQHEQQHQELLLTDLKHLLSHNPLDPVYRPQWPLAAVAPQPLRWCGFDGGRAEIGHAGPGFGFDNEGPRHAVLLQPFALSSGNPDAEHLGPGFASAFRGHPVPPI